MADKMARSAPEFAEPEFELGFGFSPEDQIDATLIDADERLESVLADIETDVSQIQSRASTDMAIFNTQVAGVIDDEIARAESELADIVAPIEAEINGELARIINESQEAVLPLVAPPEQPQQESEASCFGLWYATAAGDHSLVVASGETPPFGYRNVPGQLPDGSIVELAWRDDFWFPPEATPFKAAGPEHADVYVGPDDERFQMSNDIAMPEGCKVQLPTPTQQPPTEQPTFPTQQPTTISPAGQDIGSDLLTQCFRLVPCGPTGEPLPPTQEGADEETKPETTEPSTRISEEETEIPSAEDKETEENPCHIFFDPQTCRFYASQNNRALGGIRDFDLGVSPLNLASIREVLRANDCIVEEDEEGVTIPIPLPLRNLPSNCNFIPADNIPVSDIEALATAGGSWLARIFNFAIGDAAIFPMMLGQMKHYLGRLAQTVGCNVEGYLDTAKSKAFLQIIEHHTGIVNPHAHKILDQHLNCICPTDVPSIPQVIGGFLANAFNDRAASELLAANGLHPKFHQALVDTARLRWSSRELAFLFRRGELDPREFGSRMRQLGYLREDQAEEALKLTEQLPSLSDITRMMVRDAADDQLAQRFQLDAEFDQKFTGKLKDWTKWQGIPDEFAKMAWRAHWVIPPPNQLFEMWHRLRDDPQWGTRQQQLDHIKTAMAQQDIAPFWRDRLLAISFSPLTRRDTRRMFEVGTIDKPRVEQAYKDQGYSDTNASDLADFVEDLTIQKFLRHSYVARTANGEFTLEELDQLLTAEGMRQSMFPTIQQRVFLLATGNRRKKCVASIRKRFLVGEFDQAKLQNLLQNEGFSGQQLQEKVREIVCDRDSRNKLATVSQLGRWLDQGTIGPEETRERLENLGYDDDTISLILAEFELRIDLRKEKEERRRKLEQQRQIKEKTRATERAERQQKRAAEKAARAAEARQRENRRRNKLILEIGRRLAGRFDSDYSDTTEDVRELLGQLNRQGLGTQDQVLDTMGVVAKINNIETFTEWAFEVSQVLAGGNLSNGQNPLLAVTLSQSQVNGNG